MRFPFDSQEAQDLNKRIFETIYYAALDASCELAEKLGPYETYPGSPVSKGVSVAKYVDIFKKHWIMLLIISLKLLFS